MRDTGLRRVRSLHVPDAGRPILSAASRDRTQLTLWAALAIAVSPLFAVAPVWLSERPESLYVLLAPVLLAWEWVRTRRAPAEPRRGPGLLLGLLAPPALLMGIETGSPTLGLGGAALGFVGIAAWTGRPRLAVAALALWLVPVPVFVLERLSPGLETIWMDLAVAITHGLGGSLAQVGPVAHGPGGTRIEFFVVDDGLLMAHGMALVGYLDALRRHTPPGVRAVRTAVFAVVGFALQGVVLTVAAWSAASGDAASGVTLLVRGPTVAIALALAGVLTIESVTARRRPRSAPEADETG